MAPLEAGRHSGHDHASGSIPYALLPAPAGVNLNITGTLKDSLRLFNMVVSIKDEGMMLVITLVTMLTPNVSSDCCFDVHRRFAGGGSSRYGGRGWTQYI